MGETLTTVIVIFLAATLMFVFPMQAISDRNDEIAKEIYKVAENDEIKNISMREAIQEFMRFNIVEREVRNVI